jgi:predicted aspartyl protease
MRFWWLRCLAVLLCLSAEAHSVVSTEGVEISRKLPLVYTDQNRTALPIRRAGNLLLIQAQADSLAGYFILDTGAPYLVLNQTYFRNYRNNPNEKSVSVNGEASDLKILEIDSLKIGHITYTEVIADATNLAQIENRKGVRILGLLGVNLFLEFELEIDLENNVLYLNRLAEDGRCLSPLSVAYARAAAFTTPFSLKRDVISFEASINQKKLRFCFDTGAEYNVLSADVSGKVMEGVNIARRVKLYGSSGGSQEVLAGSINFIEISGFRIANMQTIISNLEELRAAYGNNIDGMMGYQLLSRGTVCINFKTREMRFYTLLTQE